MTGRNHRRALPSWLALFSMVGLCGVLALLQWRWLGEVSRAERERLRGSLQASLYRLSQDFNSEITTACLALLPYGFDREWLDRDYSARYEQWRNNSRHPRLFSRLGLAAPRETGVGLRRFDLNTGVLSAAEWPQEWTVLRERLAMWADRERSRIPPPPDTPQHEPPVLLVPRMGLPSPGAPRINPRETEWLIAELDLDYVRSVLLPEIVQRHLGHGGVLDYQVEVVARGDPGTVIYQANGEGRPRIAGRADASVGLFEIQYERLAQRIGRNGPNETRMRFAGPRDHQGTPGILFSPSEARMRFAGPRGRPGGPGPDFGRWEMSVLHRSGSLEAVVERARWRNLAVVAGLLSLMLAAAAALIRFTRQAQRLAELQLQFVAGVSHELRTPLTVIRTAAYNLKGKLARNPDQVERYGTLIQGESQRLSDLVEEVLQFATSRSGRPVRDPEPVSIGAVIGESLEAGRAVLGNVQVEQRIAPDLPVVMGDPVALKHVFDNLLSNAAKYGSGHPGGIEISAQNKDLEGRTFVEARVSDHGPGIPHDEQKHIFDPFFRGKRAIQEQIHGTGLGLSLVKGIVEAHGGTIHVVSAPGHGAEFIVRFPAVTVEKQDELSHSIDRG